MSAGATAFSLSESQRADILAMLDPLLDGADPDEVLSRVELAVNLCISLRDAGANRPAPTQKSVTRAALQLGAAARNLRKAIRDLGNIPLFLFDLPTEPAELRDSPSEFPTTLRGSPVEISWFQHIDSVAEFGEKIARNAESQADFYPDSKGGAPPMVAEMELAFELAVLWVESTGRTISRQNWSEYREYEDDGPFLRFLQVVIGYTNPQKKGDYAWLVRRLERQFKERGGFSRGEGEDSSTG